MTEINKKASALTSKYEAAKQKLLQQWNAAEVVGGTPGEEYLRSLGLSPETYSLAPIKFARSLDASSSDREGEENAPALLASFEDPRGLFGGFQAIRLVQSAGQGRTRTNMICLGATVRLRPCNGTLYLAQSLVSALAIQQISGQPTWAYITLANLGFVTVPDAVTEVVLMPDQVAPASEAVSTSVQAAADRLRTDGRTVQVIWPSEQGQYAEWVLQAAA